MPSPEKITSIDTHDNKPPPLNNLPPQLDDKEQMARLMVETQRFRQRTVVWLIVAIIWILTCKHLVANSYHYPATLALQSFLSLHIIYWIALISSHWYSKLHHTRDNELYARIVKYNWQPNHIWLKMIPPSLAAAASIPLFMEGLLHMPSLPVIIMILPLMYASEALVLKIWFFRMSRCQLPYEVLITIAMSSLILYNEYRLMVNGLICGILGILLAGLAKALFTICAPSAQLDDMIAPFTYQPKFRAYHCFMVMTSLFGSILSNFTKWSYESEILTASWSTTLLLALNIASFVSLAFIGASFLEYSPSSISPRKAAVPGCEFIGTVVASSATLIFSVIFSPIVLSGAQIFCWIISILSISTLKLSTNGNPQAELAKWLEVPRKHKWSKRVILLCLFANLVILSGPVIYISSHVRLSFVSSGIPATLDLKYNHTAANASRFDIVVSIYDESHSSVKSMLDKIKSTSLLRSLEPNIIIYTKKSSEDLPALQKATGATSVFKLENLGREGATYLHHIVNSWDTLAQQTIFIQAYPHNMREVIPRINSYLAPSTGFLSLGYAGIICDCLSCTDRWDSDDQVHLFPTLYQQIYSHPCTARTKLLLTYKGQFAASARRIRGIPKSIYQKLLTTLTSPVILHPNVTGNYENTPGAPYFGYALERAWGVLMQCGTDMRVATQCPSLLSGVGWSEEGAGDCGCLDEF